MVLYGQGTSKVPAGLESILAFYAVWAREMPKVRAVHLIGYEGLRAETEKTLAGVLEFLGTPASPEQVKDAVEYAAFENMRRIEETRTFWRSGKRMVAGEKGNPDSYKVRRAKVGGWRDYFSEEQAAAIDARVDAELAPIYGYGCA